MRRLKFEYKMELKFSSPVNSHYFALRCIPADSSRQQICLTERQVAPADYIAEVKDGFGNQKISGCCAGPHDAFGYHIAGIAQVDGTAVERESLHPIYRYPSWYTRYEKEVIAFAKTVEKEWEKEHMGEEMAKAVCAMNYLYSHFEYIPGATDIRTTAAEALRLGKGVCQDYAHILTAVLRFLGIPARYANGLMIGEGYSHAWTEVYADGGWRGLDPTNNLLVDDYYIKLAHGRDYGDCVIDKGIFWGNASQEQKIYVNVEEIIDDRNSRINGTACR